MTTKPLLCVRGVITWWASLRGNMGSRKAMAVRYIEAWAQQKTVNPYCPSKLLQTTGSWISKKRKKFQNVMFRFIRLEKCSLFITDVKYLCLLNLNEDVCNCTDFFTWRLMFVLDYRTEKSQTRSLTFVFSYTPVRLNEEQMESFFEVCCCLSDLCVCVCTRVYVYIYVCVWVCILASSFA